MFYSVINYCSIMWGTKKLANIVTFRIKPWQTIYILTSIPQAAALLMTWDENVLDIYFHSIIVKLGMLKLMFRTDWLIYPNPSLSINISRQFFKMQKKMFFWHQTDNWINKPKVFILFASNFASNLRI